MIGADLRFEARRCDGMDDSRCAGVGPPSGTGSGVSSKELPIDMGRSATRGTGVVEAAIAGAYSNGAGGAATGGAEPKRMLELRRRGLSAVSRAASLSAGRVSSLLD